MQNLKHNQTSGFHESWGTLCNSLKPGSRVPVWVLWRGEMSLLAAGIEPRFCSSRLYLKCDGTRAKTRFRISAKRTSPFKSAGASVQSDY